MKIVNPATGEILRDIQNTSPNEIQTLVYDSRQAQPVWAKVPYENKKAIISNFRDLLKGNLQDLAQTLTLEVGKPIQQSINELNSTVDRINYFLENTQKLVETETVLSEGPLSETIQWEPLGVVANISAWNYPYFVGSNVFIPALLTGNAVLYKPSEFATLTGLKIQSLLHEAGVPKTIFALVIGNGETGKHLIDSDIDAIFFTGSNFTGKKIAEAAGKKMIHYQVELGGKDPAYICEDAELTASVASVCDGAFYNAGQSCCGVERIYVQETIFDLFIEKFLREVQKLKMGDPQSLDTTLGPLTREAQIEVLEKQCKDALSKGAKLLCGGKRHPGKGNFFEPTVFINVNHEMELMKEESFGPIIGIQSVKDDKEAVRLMKDTHYGLTSSVFTSDKERARKILTQMDSGSVYWNCCDRISPRLPWSGRKDSGMGSTLSTVGIRTFTRPKAWHEKSAP